MRFAFLSIVSSELKQPVSSSIPVSTPLESSFIGSEAVSRSSEQFGLSPTGLASFAHVTAFVILQERPVTLPPVISFAFAIDDNEVEIRLFVFIGFAGNP